MSKFKVRRLLKFKAGDFRHGFINWQERRRRGTSLRYFLRKPREDSRTTFGKRIDTLGGLMLVWLASFILLANFTGRPAVALVLSVPLLAAEALLLKKIFALLELRKQEQRKFWTAGQKFMEGISKKSQAEFLTYVREILAGLTGFQAASQTTAKKAKTRNEQGADLELTYNGTPVVVRCSLLEADKKVASEEVRSFAGTLSLGNFKNGIYVTSSNFENGVLSVVRKASRRGIRIRLVNRYRLMDLARQAGCSAFREKEDSPAALSSGVGRKRLDSVMAFLDSAFGSRKKARNYFLYGLLLYGGYFLLKGSVLSIVYLLFASLNFLMGAGSLYFGRSLEEMDPLEGLEAEN